VRRAVYLTSSGSSWRLLGSVRLAGHECIVRSRVGRPEVQPGASRESLRPAVRADAGRDVSLSETRPVVARDLNPREFAELAAALRKAPSPDRTAEQVISYAVQQLDVDHAGITLLRRGGRLETIAATDPLVERLDALQSELGEGTSRDNSWHGEALVAVDLGSDPRWPRWGSKTAELGVACLLAVEFTNASTCELQSRLEAARLSKAPALSPTEGPAQRTTRTAARARRSLDGGRARASSLVRARRLNRSVSHGSGNVAETSGRWSRCRRDEGPCVALSRLLNSHRRNRLVRRGIPFDWIVDRMRANAGGPSRVRGALALGSSRRSAEEAPPGGSGGRS